MVARMVAYISCLVVSGSVELAQRRAAELGETEASINQVARLQAVGQLC